ncbi:MAG: DUF3817 domain-containing protein [Gelidibacter sp.]
MFSLVTIFRIIAFLEGVSYILLLGIAVPIKYVFENPAYVKLLGMPHGLLFIAYLILAIIIGSNLKWTNKMLFQVLLASIIPFGTFFIDRRYFKTAA